MREEHESLRWMVGVDARELSGGALAFARWLAGSESHVIFGVHVVEWMPSMFEEASRPETVRRMAEETLQPLAKDRHFFELGAVLANSAENGLLEALRAKRAGALVIGRRAPRAGRTLVRLGRVARRMVRALPTPVVVVPPDLQDSEIGLGPVVVATDLTESCAEAVRWGAALATEMRRGLVLLHAIHPPDRGPYVPADLWDYALDSARDVEGAFQSWARHHGVGEAPRVRVEGAPVQVLTEAARARDACVLVTGSRRLGGVERLFLSSLGTELAATASIPVAIVPPVSAPT